MSNTVQMKKPAFNLSDEDLRFLPKTARSVLADVDRIIQIGCKAEKIGIAQKNMGMLIHAIKQRPGPKIPVERFEVGILYRGYLLYPT